MPEHSRVEDDSEDRSDEDGRDLTLRWSGQISLTRRILAVNIFALLLLAGGFFYLDSYRSRIVDSRVVQATREARLIAEALAVAPADRRVLLIRRVARVACTTRRARNSTADRSVSATSR